MQGLLAQLLLFAAIVRGLQLLFFLFMGQEEEEEQNEDEDEEEWEEDEGYYSG